MGLGAWLLRWRAASRLTQADVARRTNIVQHQISRLEHDQIDRPSMQDVVKIVQVYGVTPNEVAQKAFGWIPPKTYKSSDYRWEFIQDWLTKASPENVDAFLSEAYDKALWFQEMERTQVEA